MRVVRQKTLSPFAFPTPWLGYRASAVPAAPVTASWRQLSAGGRPSRTDRIVKDDVEIVQMSRAGAQGRKQSYHTGERTPEGKRSIKKSHPDLWQLGNWQSERLSGCQGYIEAMNMNVLVFKRASLLKNAREGEEVLLPLQHSHGPEQDRVEVEDTPGRERGLGGQGGVQQSVPVRMSWKDMLFRTK